MSRGLILGLIIFAFSGCALNKPVVIHPLEKDFKSVKAGETVTVEKDGYLVSKYWISDVAGFEVENG